MAASGKGNMLFVTALIVVGLALLGWAIYGAMLLRGDAAIDGKENVESMAKLMLFGGGPLGAVLIIAGVATRVMRRR